MNTIKIIQDLGTRISLNGHKVRYCIYECNNCKQHIEAITSNVKRNKTGMCHKCSNIEHGKSNNKLYSIWRGIKTRCYNKNSNAYKNYGERGITMCNEWVESFSAFYSWAINNNYCLNLSIDRIDNNSNYSPENCRWTTQDIQSRNIRKKNSNTSGYIGVGFFQNSWYARIKINTKVKHIRYFKTKDEAAIARNNYIDAYDTGHTKNIIGGY